MRLSREMIKHISDAIVANLESRGLVKYTVRREVIAAKVADVITTNMLEEDKLNEEVKNLLFAHESEMAESRMDYRKVFELTKQKLAKERGMVL